MCVDSATLVDDFHVNDVVSFPNAPLAIMLVQCGADVNARDLRGNTPLHVIVRYTNPISDFDTLHRIMTALIGSHAHLDIRNSDRRTPMQCTTTGVAEVILRQYSQPCLKCIAARVIRDHNLPYQGQIPSVLEEFVHLH